MPPLRELAGGGGSLGALPHEICLLAPNSEKTEMKRMGKQLLSSAVVVPGRVLVPSTAAFPPVPFRLRIPLPLPPKGANLGFSPQFLTIFSKKKKKSIW